MKIVKVLWIDTSSNHEWKSAEAMKKWGNEDMVIESIGFLIDKNNKHVVLSGMMASDGESGIQQRIPRGCVKKITYIK